MKKIAIIGGGLVGLSTAYKLFKYNPKLRITVFEKELTLGKHQSGKNSGVMHAGLYYKHGTLKARMAVDGIRQMTSFCKENKINYDICGKIVVATNELEQKILNSLSINGKKNGLKGLKILNKNELKKREPFVRSYESLLVPEEGIVDFKMVLNSLYEHIKNFGGSVLLGHEIKNIFNKNNATVIQCDNYENEFDILVNCSGLYSDRIFKKSFKKNNLKIIPFRGEYLKLKNESSNLVNHLIYPVPDPNFPFLGVHFTRTIHGYKEVGPNAVIAFHREGYTNKTVSFYDIFDTFTYPGMYKFVLKNFSFSLGQLYSSFFTSSFINQAKKLVPDINKNMVEKGTSGVRAQAMNDSGELIMDFDIKKIGNQIHVLNAPSPGATSCLAIADYIIDKYVLSSL